MTFWNTVYIIISVLAVFSSWIPSQPFPYAGGLLMSVWVAMTALLILGVI